MYFSDSDSIYYITTGNVCQLFCGIWLTKSCFFVMSMQIEIINRSILANKIFNSVFAALNY